MTIAIIIKVKDGIVLASDSAVTMSFESGIKRIYDHSNKIFNLVKGYPVGAITWGLGNIGVASISTLVKDFRKIITEDSNLKIGEVYSIEDISQKFKNFIFQDKYESVYKDIEKEKRPYLGFIIAGYSSDQDLAEEWEITITKGDFIGPNMVRERNQTGVAWRGQGEVVFRVYNGYSPQLRNILAKSNLDEDKINEILTLCDQELNALLTSNAMPIQDAIDVAKFLVDTAIKYSKYGPGDSSVGGAIEIAAITKHEGFKWIQRKHYFSKELNP